MFQIIDTQFVSIQEGVSQTTSYGLALARTVRFPRVILERANEIHRELTSGENLNQAAVSIKTRFKNESLTHYKICYPF